ncbi:MFS transporter [Streptomyces tateyamensis]|uniref:MFS transporter n=1 Tax=Streptomyces tateyamensis TaxID=565073 RepID=UPI001FE44B2D|nr:MFS transporter [Streptomyces tateyamensis]
MPLRNPRFARFWAANAASTLGSGLALSAFLLLAVRVLHAGPAAVGALAATGAAVGAALAVPLGPWVERRRKRPVMVAADLFRCLALLSVPAAYALGRLGFAQLLVVAVLVATADIAFTAAAGACLKALVPPAELLCANARLEATSWTAIVVGPPLGGAAVGLFGPAVTVVADAVSYLLSALGLGSIGREAPAPSPSPPAEPRLRAADLLDGWRWILADPALRPLFANTVLFNALLLATEPLLVLLLVGRLHFSPVQFGLTLALPCLGGLLGSRLSRRLVARFGERRVLVTTGMVRGCFPLWLAFAGPGRSGQLLVMELQFAMICAIGAFNPVLATYRLNRIPTDRIARTLTAWSVTTKATTAALTALWGLLATLTGPRAGLALAGLLLLPTGALLRRVTTPQVTAPAADLRPAG